MSLTSDMLNGWGVRPGELATDASWAASSIVAEICMRAGVPVERINLQGLEGSISGLSHSPSDAAHVGIESMGQILNFDGANFDGQLHFVQRGRNSVAALTTDDLVDDGKEIRQLNRKDSITVPRVLHLEYFDLDGGLSADKQTSDRSLDSRSTAEVKIQTAVLMNSADAGRAAIINHKIAIEEQRGGYEFSLPDAWVWLTTGDIITLNGERLRVTEVEIDEGFQRYKTTFDRASSYRTTITGVPVPEPIPPPSLIVGDTVLHFIDSHIIRDTDDRLGYYVAVGRASDNWNGALVELSLDGGETYINSIDAAVEATVGELLDPLPSVSVWVPDAHNATRVRLLLDDDLESADLRGMMNRQNLAMIGNEIINFGEAEEVEPQVWELSHFLRGRKGSPVTSHAAGERFIMMERSYLWFIDAELFVLGRPITFRATSFGGTVQTVVTATFTGQSQAERQPAYLQAQRRAGQITINWQGVGRLGGGTQVNMGQHFAGYRVTINGTPQQTPNQTLTITDPGGAVTISVQQLNNLTGPGPAATVTL